ncbi:hypothetical protein ABK040_004812 [Willaertia magna]
MSFGSSIVFTFGDPNGKRGYSKDTTSLPEEPVFISKYEVLKGDATSDSEVMVEEHNDIHIVDVTMGYTQTILIDKLGRTFGCGSSNRGQSGHNKDEIIIPRQIFNLRNEFIIQASCGYYFTIYLNNKGQVFGSGDNSFEQLPALKEKDQMRLPILCPIPDDIFIKSIHTGYYHSMVIDKNGKVYVAGQHFGSFHQVTSLDNVFIVSAGGGYESSFFVSKEGDVYGSGKVGVPSQMSLHTDSFKNPFKITGFNHPICKVASGYYQTLFCSTMESGGILYSCGEGQYNSTARDIEISKFNAEDKEILEHKFFSNVTQVSCGGYHSALLDGKEKVMYVFGLSGMNQAPSSDKQPYKVVFNKTLDSGLYKTVKAVAGGWTSALLVHKIESPSMMKKLGNYVMEQANKHSLFDITIV